MPRAWHRLCAWSLGAAVAILATPAIAEDDGRACASDPPQGPIAPILGVAKQATFSDCDANQLSMNGCAQYRFVLADAELRKISDNVPPALEIPEDRDRFASAEKAWCQYRDQSCAFERGLWDGGSAAGYAYYSCLASHDRQRAAVLKAFMSCLDKCSPGDISLSGFETGLVSPTEPEP